MIFFDYLYYSIYEFYVSYKDNNPQLAASSILGILYMMGVCAVLMSVELVSGHNGITNKTILVAVGLGFQVYNYIRYVYREKPSTDFLREKWIGKPEAWRKSMRFYFYLYAFASIVGFIGLAICKTANK